MLRRYSLPTRTLIICALVVAATCAALPFGSFSFTYLAVAIQLCAAFLWEDSLSPRFPELYVAALSVTTLLTGVLIFLLPAGAWWVVSRRRWPRLSTVALATWCALYLGCLLFLFPIDFIGKVPPILRGVSAGGGYSSACPPPKDTGITDTGPLAISPEFNDRLAKQFPPGSPEGNMVSALTAIGFTSLGACDTDPEIKILAFRNDGTSAVVYWRTDSQERIVWTKGFVAYTFL